MPKRTTWFKIKRLYADGGMSMEEIRANAPHIADRLVRDTAHAQTHGAKINWSRYATEPPKETTLKKLERMLRRNQITIEYVREKAPGVADMLTHRAEAHALSTWEQAMAHDQAMARADADSSLLPGEEIPEFFD
eukprot:12414555-Karenia_brevis.AAC.1